MKNLSDLGAVAYGATSVPNQYSFAGLIGHPPRMVRRTGHLMLARWPRLRVQRLPSAVQPATWP